MPKTRRSDGTNVQSPGQTLEDVLTGAWEDLVAGSRTECPVCSGVMEASGPSAGRCGGCGSELL